ncbi:MAG: RNA-binding domain-containing protein [Thermoplasmatota archaeon]
MAQPRFHWLRLRAMAFATEEVERVSHAVAFVAGVEPGVVQVAPLESHHGQPMQVVEANLPKSRAARAVLERVLALPGAREALVATLEARVDDDAVFYLRVDKQAAYQGRLELSTGEDCVQCRFRVESYPASRAGAVQALKAALES